MILVTGAGGFIGGSLVEALGPVAKPAGHCAIGAPGLLDGVTAVVHAGRDPRLGTPDYRLEDDVELASAERAAERGLPFISLSTRKVYAPADAPLAEDAALGPLDRYGAQKLALETALAARLGDRLTVLRLANIFGHERGRRGFFGAMIDGVERQGQITFDMSPFVVRDFLPVELAGQAIATLAATPPGGIVNIGSGVPLETGRLAIALIEGLGQGQLVVADSSAHDTFVLDVGRMVELTGITVDREHLLDTAREIGRRLRVGSASDQASC